LSWFSTIKDAETGRRGFQLTLDTIYLQPYFSSVKTLPVELKELDSLVKDNPEQTKRVDTLQQLTNNQFAIISKILSNARRSSLYMDRYESDLLLDGRRNMDEIRRITGEIREAEQASFNEMISDETDFRNIAPISLLFYGLVPLAGIAFYFPEY
jgi:CHASE3 domain sensor protein